MIIDFSNINGGGGGGYVLPIASDTTLGGVKVGSGLTINSGGTLSADAQPVDVATTATTGVVKIGEGVNIENDGTISVDLSDYAKTEVLSGYVETSAMSGYQTTEGMSGYVQTTQIATTASTGVVKIGSGINVDSAGTISVSAQTPTKLQSTGIENVVNDNFALVYTLEDLGIWTTDNSGYTIDLSYVSEDFIGNIGNGSSIINGYQNGVSFGVEITADGLKTSCVDTDDWILLYELTGLTYGTYTVGSGETYEAVIEYTPDNKFSVHFTNGLAYPPDLAYGGVFTPVWKQENVFYKIKQRQPIATTGHTGMVKIGSGISIDAEGTISVTGGTGGGGIEVVTELPSSGTDGQTVMLVQHLPEKKLIVQPNINSQTLSVSVTAIGLTNAITVYNYEWYGARNYVTVNPDHSVDLYNDYDQQTTNYPVSADSYTYTQPNTPNNLTLTITETGFTIVSQAAIAKENIVNDINQEQEEIETLYTWSDEPTLTADIDYISSTGSPWCVRFRYSSIPNNTTLVVWKYVYGEDYRHLVYENNALHIYASSSADTYTATTYVNVAQYGFITERYGRVYWTEDEIIVFSTDAANRVNINENAFYLIGWHKNLEHYISNKAMFKDYVFYDKDYQIIIKHPDFPMYNVGLRINPTGQYNTPAEVYSKNNATIGPFFAPTTTGSTGQVCIAGNGWAAPTWTNPENLTNGVKFWKGTLDEYEAIGEGNYDANTLYICTDE